MDRGDESSGDLDIKALDAMDAAQVMTMLAAEVEEFKKSVANLNRLINSAAATSVQGRIKAHRSKQLFIAKKNQRLKRLSNYVKYRFGYDSSKLQHVQAARLELSTGPARNMGRS